MGEEAVATLQRYLEEDRMRMYETLRYGQMELWQTEELLGKLALEEFKGFKDEMAAERKAREEQEEALLETLRDVIQRVRGALTGERRHGEDGGDFRELGGCHSNKLNHVNNEM